MLQFGPVSVAIAFWVFLGVAAVAGIVADYKKRQIALEPLRAAIERGQQLDPEVVERLLAPEARAALNPLYLRVGGIITVATGVGVIILSFLLTQIVPFVFYPVLGGGIVVLCIGVGLIIAARTVETHASRAETHRP